MTTLTLRLIKDETDYDAVLERIDQIFDASLGTPEGDELKVLLRMVDTYQTRNSLLPAGDPVEVIKFVMKQQGLTLHDIAHFLDGEEMACQIMMGKKSLTPQMIQALSTNLHIPTGALV
jgi:HTH-type transcriptional regulator / antitoxin HigA